MSEELLIRFLTRTCTPDELLEAEKWISTDSANAGWLFGMERAWSLKDELRHSDRIEIEDAYRRFVRTVSQTKQRRAVKRQLHSGWMKYAAAIVIVFLIAANVYQAFMNKSSDETVASTTIEVPTGQRVSLTLADGTRVWLNSGSILSYPAKFDQKNRMVRLDGEGYFEATADRDYPFVVQTAKLDVKVLGTKFNVQAYPDEDIEVSLLEGQLYVQAGRQSALMEANELVTWSKVAGLIHYKNKELQHITQWTSGELMFVDERLAGIAKTLERHFGVSIIFDAPELADERFTCRTQPGATLEQVLNLLKSTKKMNYSIKGKTVTIKTYNAYDR